MDTAGKCREVSTPTGLCPLVPRHAEPQQYPRSFQGQARGGEGVKGTQGEHEVSAWGKSNSKNLRFRRKLQAPRFGLAPCVGVLTLCLLRRPREGPLELIFSPSACKAIRPLLQNRNKHGWPSATPGDGLLLARREGMQSARKAVVDPQEHAEHLETRRQLSTKLQNSFAHHVATHGDMVQLACLPI